MATTREQLKLDGKAELRRGVEVTIRGLGRCRFGSATIDESGAVRWVDVYDGRNGGQHSVAVERVGTVHRKTKLRAAAR